MSVEELGLGLAAIGSDLSVSNNDKKLKLGRTNPFPSHHRAPPPSIRLPEAPVTVMSVPETEIKGPDHSSYPNEVVPSKMT